MNEELTPAEEIAEPIETDIEATDTDLDFEIVEDEPEPAKAEAAPLTPEEIEAIRAENAALKAKQEAWKPFYEEMESQNILSHADMEAALARKKEAEEQARIEAENREWAKAKEAELAGIKESLDAQLEAMVITPAERDRQYNTELRLAQLEANARQKQQIEAQQARQWEAAQELLAANAVQTSMATVFQGRKAPKIAALLQRYELDEIPSVAKDIADDVNALIESEVAKRLAKKQGQRASVTPEGAGQRTERGGGAKRLDGEAKDDPFHIPTWAEVEEWKRNNSKNPL